MDALAGAVPGPGRHRERRRAGERRARNTCTRPGGGDRRCPVASPAGRRARAHQGHRLGLRSQSPDSGAGHGPGGPGRPGHHLSDHHRSFGHLLLREPAGGDLCPRGAGGRDGHRPLRRRPGTAAVSQHSRLPPRPRRHDRRHRHTGRRGAGLRRPRHGRRPGARPGPGRGRHASARCRDRFRRWATAGAPAGALPAERPPFSAGPARRPL